MVFEYDPNKSTENKRKHGIDFEDAQRLWADPGVVEIPARTSDEPRWLLIGKIDEKHWVRDNHSARREHSAHFRTAVTG